MTSVRSFQVMRVAIVVLVAVFLLLLMRDEVVAADLNAPFYVTGGVFHPRLEAGGLGFAVRNYRGGPHFYDAYRRFGGVEMLGPPISRPWISDGGFAYQLVQRALLQWSPEDNRVRLANIFELLDRPVYAAELHARHIPMSAERQPQSLELARAERRLWMTDRQIAEAFANNPIQAGSLDASLEIHGFPMSRPVRLGPFVVQRFQRTALQHWVEQVDGGQPVGSVVLVNAGDIYRDLAIPDSILADPHHPTQVVVLDVRLDPPSDAGLVPIPVALRTYAVTDSRILEAVMLLETVSVNEAALDLAADMGLHMRFGKMANNMLASFEVGKGIRINELIRNEDIRALTAVLAHELRHFEDYWNNRLSNGFGSCLAAENRAVQREAETWLVLVGDEVIQRSSGVLARIESRRAEIYASGKEKLRLYVNRLYRKACL